MQVPERLALIGGSILLASTLIFTLKSQASTIIPKVSHSISGIYDHIGDAKETSDFNSNLKQAQQKGWTTGQWGTAPYYIDDQQNMYVGSGELRDNLHEAVGMDKTRPLKALNFTTTVKAPADSSFLLQPSNVGVSNDLVAINGLSNMDVSQVTNMSSMFENDYSVQGLDINNWDTRNVTNMHSVFYNDSSLGALNLGDWQTPNLREADHMFSGNTSLRSLDITNFNTTNSSMEFIFGGQYISKDDNLKHLKMGNDVYLANWVGLDGDWNNGQETISAEALMTTTPPSSSASTSHDNHSGDWYRK